MKMFKEDNYHYFGNTNYGKPIFTAEITIPDDYVFENHLDSFFKDSNKKHPSGDNFLITDENFKKVSNVMKSGEKYRTMLVPIKDYISHCQHCVEDLTKAGISFFGAQGLALFCQKVFTGRYTWVPDCKIISFDKRESLFYQKGSEIEQLPYAYYRNNEGIVEYGTKNFWSSLPSRGVCLLIFEKV